MTHVVMSVNFPEGTILMSEVASSPVGAVFFLVELSAVLTFVLFMLCLRLIDADNHGLQG